jgi:hypothetical protein
LQPTQKSSAVEVQRSEYHRKLGCKKTAILTAAPSFLPPLSNENQTAFSVRTEIHFSADGYRN